MSKYTGMRYIPRVMGDWDNSKNTEYENLSVVLYGGDSYTSKKIVPKGIDISNTEYWIKSADYNAQVAIYRNDVNNYKTETENNLLFRLVDIPTIANKYIQAKNSSIIKIIGDSLAGGVGGSNYLQDGDTIFGSYKVNTSGHCWANSLKTILESKFTCTVKNWGIGGLTSSDIVNNLDTLISSNDSLILCLIGGNNRGLTNGMDTLKNDLNTIYNYVKDKGKDIIFISGNPSLQSFESTKLYTMGDVDTAMASVCLSLGVEYISFYKDFINFYESKGIDLQYLLNGDVHPNDIGYDILYYIICNKLCISLPKSIDGLANLVLIEDGTDLDILTTPNTKYYTKGDASALTMISTPNGITKSFAVEFYKTTSTSTYANYGVQKLILRDGTEYIRALDADIWQPWKRTMYSENSGWITPTLSSGVSNYSETFDQVKCKKVDNTVYLVGRVVGLTTQGQQTVELPVGYRPTICNHRYSSWKKNNVQTAITIDTSGILTIGTADLGAFTPSDFFFVNTSFPVD